MKKLLLTIAVLTILCLAQRADAAIVRQTTATAGTSAGASSLATTAFAATAGNVIVACIRDAHTANISSVVDTAGNTYTLAAEDRSRDPNVSMYYAQNITGNAADQVTVNFSASAQYAWIYAVQYSGMAASAYDTANANIASGVSTLSSTPFSTAQASEVAVMCGAQNAFATYTAGTDFSLISGSIQGAPGDNIGGIEDYITSSKLTTYTATMVSGSSNPYTAVVGAFKGAASSAASTPSCNHRLCIFKRLSLRSRLCLSRSCPPNPSVTNVTNGLVAWWKFDDGSGASAVDSSGNGNTASLVASPPWVTGKIGPFALSFNSTTQYANGGDIAAADNTTTISVSAWVKFTSASTGVLQTVASKNRNGFTGWQLYKSRFDDFQFSIMGATVTAIAVSDSTYPDTNWHHLVGVYNGTDVRIYVDGVSADSTPASQTENIPASTYLTCIGSEDNDCLTFSQAMNGSIDDVRIYNRALTASEVTTIYNYR